MKNGTDSGHWYMKNCEILKYKNLIINTNVVAKSRY